MIVNQTFYIVTHIDAHALDVGCKYGWSQGIISEFKTIASQKWNLIPYFKNGTVFFLLVNEDNTILAHDNPNSNTVAYGYDPQTITYMHCWSIAQDSNNNTLFKVIGSDFKNTNYVLTSNGNQIGNNARISQFNENDNDQKWELIDKISTTDMSCNL
jgi:hypothetical protein